jgi:hypothetical protein
LFGFGNELILVTGNCRVVVEVTANCAVRPAGAFQVLRDGNNFQGDMEPAFASTRNSSDDAELELRKGRKSAGAAKEMSCRKERSEIQYYSSHRQDILWIRIRHGVTNVDA